MILKVMTAKVLNRVVMSMITNLGKEITPTLPAQEDLHDLAGDLDLPE